MILRSCLSCASPRVTFLLFVAVFVSQWLLWDAEPVPFWLSPAYVLPRTLRYSLVDNPKKPGTSTIRVYKPLAMWGEPTFDQELNNELLAIMASPDYVADQYKLGGVWMRDKSGKQFKVRWLPSC
jgi:hypothetical protein